MAGARIALPMKAEEDTTADLAEPLITRTAATIAATHNQLAVGGRAQTQVVQRLSVITVADRAGAMVAATIMAAAMVAAAVAVMVTAADMTADISKRGFLKH